MSLWPSRQQWQRWSLPSKLTFIGTLLAVISLGLYGIEKAFQLKDLIFSYTNQVPLKQPRFAENVEFFIFSLGGNSSSYKVADLEKEPRQPFNFSGFKPVKLYVERGVLYADISIYGGSGMPPLKINRNQLSGKPPDWDFNSNEKALEVVNERNLPIYQFYYKTPNHIVVNGVFTYPGGLMLANTEGMILNPFLPASFRLKPIFKYPSWKYHGEYAD